VGCALQASRCKLAWNQKGTHVLCQSIADFDKTNQSYFGESRLYLLSGDGSVDMAVAMDDDPSIVDMAWAPDGETFVALGGHQPTQAVLYSAKGKVLNKMMSGPYNTIRWSPQGRFILLAGFGNLPGDIQLFEKTENGPETMGACRYCSSVHVLVVTGRPVGKQHV
jgi:translation initiation factor 2A